MHLQESDDDMGVAQQDDAADDTHVGMVRTDKKLLLQGVLLILEQATEPLLSHCRLVDHHRLHRGCYQLRWQQRW